MTFPSSFNIKQKRSYIYHCFKFLSYIKTQVKKLKYNYKSIQGITRICFENNGLEIRGQFLYSKSQMGELAIKHSVKWLNNLKKTCYHEKSHVSRSYS